MDKELKNNRRTAPSWMRLDNAATIYPANMTRQFSVMFRFSAALTEEVDPVLLDRALKNVLRRMPSFSYRLKEGIFWCYFRHIDGTPGVSQDVGNPMTRIRWKENNYFMFRVRYFGKRVSAEFFHAVTDGTGGLTFFLTLLAEYLRLGHGIRISYGGRILDPEAAPDPGEYEDSFSVYARNTGTMEKERKAYHVRGTEEKKHILDIITGKIPVARIKEEADRYGCTVTAFLTSVMIDSLQSLQKAENDPHRRHMPIKISIPVNLRRFYPSRTLRNFSSYVNVGIDGWLGEYSLDEIAVQVKSQMDMMITEKRLNAKISGNTALAKNIFVRLVPMFIKKFVISAIELRMGDNYISQNLSNMGNVELPKEMAAYVTDLNFILGRSRNKAGSASCISYNGNLYITFTRKIKETSFEKNFFTRLVEMGIPVEIESNQREDEECHTV